MVWCFEAAEVDNLILISMTSPSPERVALSVLSSSQHLTRPLNVVKPFDMETLLEAFPISPEFGSRERIANHIELMQKFKCILESVEQPGGDTKAFPTPPRRNLDQEEEGKWRLQCLLMSAEVRYSMYLQILNKWITSHGIRTPKDPWPLPPWDVAIMFYAHLLSPFNFQKDMELNYPNLWKAEIEFPLAKILSTNTDEESKLVWKEEYPDIPYQIVEFTPAGEPIYVTENAMDIHGYKCHWIGCLWRAANVIPMIKWAKYRVSRTDLVCPGCNHRIRAAKAEDALELCQREFGFPIFNLWDSPQRQFGKQGFVDRILALAQNQDQTQDQFQDHVFRYLKFLQLMKENQNTLVPTLDIDLIWHTHQLSPVAYEKYCKTHIGRPINHVDTIRAMRRSKKEDNTASLWATRYSESYHDPQNPEKTAEIERRKAACQKDSEDIEAKLTAFDKDHEHLKKDLDEIKVRLETKLADYRTVQDASTALNAEIAGIETSIRSIKPKLRLPGLRYYNKQQKQHIAKLQNKLQPLGERRLYKSREVESRYHEYDREYQDQRHKLGLSNTARRERQALEQQLTRKVTEAKAAIWRFKGEQLEDRYNGSWYSIVPSEAQLGVYPILDDPANRIIFYRGYVGSSGVGGYGGSDGGFGVGCSGFGDAGCGAGCGGGSGGGCGGS